jgi:putative endonuclease
MSKTYCVYILASRSRNLYTGVTNNLHRRLAEHRLGVVPGFTSRYKIFRLVHYEVYGDVRAAIAREKQIKAWRREKRVWLIEGENSTWSDLSEGWFRDEQKRKS